MSLWKDYLLANSIQEALQFMRQSAPPVEIVAGGTDLMLDIQQGRHRPPATLIDINRIPEMNQLELQEGRLFIGACVPVSAIARSELVIEHAQAVAEGCALIGGPQVRNTATLGGNVAHALPAADGMIGLVCLDAVAVVAGQRGLREEAILNLFKGPGKSALIPGEELLVGFFIEGRRGVQASAFQRIMRPQGVALPILNLAVWLERDGEQIARIRIAVGPAGPVPQRAHAVEAYLTGKTYNKANIAEACKVLHETVHYRTSPFRASADYRQEISETLLVETLSTAWRRAEGG